MAIGTGFRSGPWKPYSRLKWQCSIKAYLEGDDGSLKVVQAETRFLAGWWLAWGWSLGLNGEGSTFF